MEELLRLPGFDGDTLVCPVGSEHSEDWKPALAYPPFKKALLAPEAPAAAAPAPAAVPLPPMPSFARSPEAVKPPPAAPEPTPSEELCPRCAHGNPEGARFCNDCGARLGAATSDPDPMLEPMPEVFPSVASTVAAIPPLDALRSSAAASVPGAQRPGSAPTKEPSFEGLHDPLAPAFVPEPEPPQQPLTPGFGSPMEAPPPEAKRPTRMGALADVEESSPLIGLPPNEIADLPVADSPVPAWKRTPVLAAFLGAAVAAAAGGWFMLGKTPAPAPVGAELNLSAPTPVASAPSAPGSEAASAPTPAPASAPIIAPAPTPAPAPQVAAEKPRRKRKRRQPPPEPAPASNPSSDRDPGGDAVLIESRFQEKPPAKAASDAPGSEEKMLESLLGDQGKYSPASAGGPTAAPQAPVAEAAEAAPREFVLPGIPRKVAAGRKAPAAPRRAPTPARPSEAPPAALPDDGNLGEPGSGTPSPTPSAAPNDVVDDSERLTLIQVQEQFDFCAQLLAQGAYGDHYDTCLCREARETAPYRGRRGFYVTTMKKAAASGKLETNAKVSSSRLDGGRALVVARWSASGSDKGREHSQSWILEDGLWCQAAP